MNCSSTNITTPTSTSTNLCKKCNREFTTKIGLKLHLRKCKLIAVDEKKESQFELETIKELAEIKKELVEVKRELTEVKELISMFNTVNLQTNFSYRNDINSSFFTNNLVNKLNTIDKFKLIFL
jgi:hypothetical protein